MLRWILPFAALWLAALPAGSQDAMRIAAVVNGRAISVFDLEMRIDVAIYSANLAPTDEMRRRLAATVLRNLIDEALQLEEAESRGIRVSEADIAAAVAQIEDGNGVPRGELDAFLAQRGIAIGAVVDRLRAQIAWSKYVGQRIRPIVAVGEDEIDEEIARLEAARGTPEYLVSEIALYGDSAASADDLRATAESIVAQLRAGADFAAAAAQFSQGSLADDGGDLGWIQEGRGRPAIERVLADMAVGAISDPIQSLDGWHIVYLRGKREVTPEPEVPVELFLSQIVLPAEAGEAPAAAGRRLAAAREISAGTSGCEALRDRGDALEDSLSGDLGWVRLDDLPERFRDAVRGLEPGAASAPLETENGVHILMVCERNDPGAETDIRDTVYDAIARRRMAVLERRLMRDLRRTAFVDLRI